MGSRTVYQVLQTTESRFGARVALQQPLGGSKQRTWSWTQHLQATNEIAAGLDTLGIRKGDIVALCSETRAEFYLADAGIMAMGAMAAALYQSYPAKDLLNTIAKSDARALFVEDPKMLEQLRTAPVEHFLLLTGDAEGAISFEALQAMGRENMAANPGRLAELTDAVRPEDPAILYLTSGATGDPKMVIASHAALVANMEMAPVALPMTPDDVTIAFLPSAHITQRVVVEMVPLFSGAPVVFSESLLKLPGEIKKHRPTVFVAPPRMWERVYSSICMEIRKKPAVVQKAFHGALGLGLAAARYRNAGKRVPLYISAPLKVADRAIFSTIRKRLGGRLRIALSGGAALGKELADFYDAIGIPLIEGYGLTEAGVVSFNPHGAPRSGSIGVLLPGVQVQFADDGEILIKSPCLFTGYYKDEGATAQVKREGWLYSGDIGHMDGDGYLYLSSRKKELIVSSTGKKVFPARVENLFKFEPLISQVVLIGDGLPFLTALFTINAPPDEQKDLQKDVQKIVGRVNAQLADFEKIRKFRILPREFTIESGELTATMKVRRMKVMENFSSEIESLYAEKNIPGI